MTIMSTELPILRELHSNVNFVQYDSPQPVCKFVLCIWFVTLVVLQLLVISYYAEQSSVVLALWVKSQF